MIFTLSLLPFISLNLNAIISSKGPPKRKISLHDRSNEGEIEICNPTALGPNLPMVPRSDHSKRCSSLKMRTEPTTVLVTYANLPCNLHFPRWNQENYEKKHISSTHFCSSTERPTYHSGHMETMNLFVIFACRQCY